MNKNLGIKTNVNNWVVADIGWERENHSTGMSTFPGEASILGVGYIHIRDSIVFFL